MQKYKPMVKEFFSDKLYDWRRSSSLTQEEAAESFHITPRAYGDLERGKYCISAVVILLFFCLLDDNTLMRIIETLRNDIFHIVRPEDCDSIT